MFQYLQESRLYWAFYLCVVLFHFLANIKGFSQENESAIKCDGDIRVGSVINSFLQVAGCLNEELIARFGIWRSQGNVLNIQYILFIT